jgi:hypothetical protein
MVAMLDTHSLCRPLTVLLAPRVLYATLRGPSQPPLAEPPLTSREFTVLGYNE